VVAKIKVSPAAENAEIGFCPYWTKFLIDPVAIKMARLRSAYVYKRVAAVLMPLQEFD
jgi:hypothetical protein